MKIKTPKIADFLLKTNFKNFPMLDEDNFRIQFAQDAEQYIDMHMHLSFSHDPSLRYKVEEMIYKGQYSFKGDENFNIFNATNMMDLYIKILRRNVSVAFFSERLGECYDTYVMPEQEMVSTASDKLKDSYKVGSAEYQKFDQAIEEKFGILIEYERNINQLIDHLCHFDVNCLDEDIQPYLMYASKVSYPLKVELVRCSFSHFKSVNVI